MYLDVKPWVKGNMYKFTHPGAYSFMISLTRKSKQNDRFLSVLVTG